MDSTYKVGDAIIYGNMGVCSVSRIEKRFSPSFNEDRLYYILKPVFQDCVIYAPVDNTSVFTRPIISKDEAERLINTIPLIQTKAYYSQRVQELISHYESYITTHDCGDLLELTISIYTKKQHLEQHNQKFGAVDKRFMKQAEELLFGELATALNISKDAVQNYIASRVVSGEVSE